MLPWRRRATAPLTGWASYHGTASVCGVPGLAMTFRHAFGPLRFMAIMDREVHGKVAYETTIDSHRDVTSAIEAAGRHTLRVPHEMPIFNAMLPGPGEDIRHHMGLPPHAAHREAARSAIAAVPMPDAMRDALMACVDHGLPTCLDALADARRESPTRDWETLALAARTPLLVEACLCRGRSSRPSLGTDPLGIMRATWPRMTPAHVRRLGAIGPDEREEMLEAVRDAAPCVADLLLDLPVDWMPRDGEWADFVKVAEAVATLALSCGGVLDRRTLVRSSKGLWREYLARLSALASGNARGRTSVPDAARHALDAMNALRAQVLYPAFARDAEAREVTFRTAPLTKASAVLLYGGKGLPAVLEASRQWHERAHAMTAMVRTGGDGSAWPPLFEGTFRTGVTEIVPLFDRLSLSEEGAPGPDRDGVPGLHHCVATRENRYRNGEAHALSVRLRLQDGTWRRLSTCQVEVDGEGRGPNRFTAVIHEHKGRRNSDPPAEAVTAVGLLCRALREGNVVPVPEALVRRVPLPTDHVSGLCGYDWRDDEAAALAVRAWEPFLPRWARGLGPDGLAQALMDRGIVPDAGKDHA